ncbi:MAG: ATP-grasp domain-containing protein [Bacteroidota bacterium]
MLKPIKVLMTGAGAPGAPGIIKCLLQSSSINLTVADADENATGKYLHHRFIQIPQTTQPHFAQTLLRICKEQKIDIVIPLVTKELAPLAHHKPAFEKEGIQILVSSAQAIAIANNKAACYNFLQQKNIALPKFFVVNEVEEFLTAAKKLGFPEKEFCFKPSLSNGSRGFRIVSNKFDAAHLLFNFKPNNTYIGFDEAIKILSAQSFPQLLVTEYLPGDEYSVDCLANNGQMIIALPRLRTKMVNGISVQGKFVNDKTIIDYCRQIIAAVGLHGNIGIQVKISTEGELLLLEINPRVQGTIVAGLGAGVNLPLLAVKQELGLPITEFELEVEWNTGFRRYWTELFY